ncbi:dipeptide/oligopeptide/nickel ABC transporter permease/ATP-binding protein [Pseudarthrobacter phenanthrenivorans]|uniref:Oligopeptide/dipeptide ABC transporter, ATP-binding protein n=1 Tax=Pseudarthrobacter phenanthrenivorans (strain DSM 18606 / JCM 16027 / LMG 23796 / Sphe3) TaxID=930171 RepID=F0MAI2_PSEPM|nr:dipeptide/oligopeptide/nickel ABC transporter permease/ATP-binding protein [Pseudarthrobacter phenanthrenivorans]ADX72850.1 oligopeptide/dipeptide ABC transporter, ATP-binding protein [Pseudarthrobacter phenanthrenivorans Sphe3]TPV53495.1 dipeptide/oligopeptide/nickel ABC transporter permease/ATP-binding protein [Pseudarthrobacter phenanthrenivorans]
MIPNVAPAPADSAEPTAAAVLPTAPRQSAARKFAGSKLFASPGSIAGVVWLAALVAASVTAPLWLPYKTEDQDFTAVLSGPTAAHWLGTDELGRDLLSRIFASAAGTLGTSMITVIVAVGLGTLLAMLAAAAGERVENAVSRVTEIMMSLPGTVIILAVIGAVGTNIPLIMAILGVLISAGMYRVMLGQAKSLQSQLYVDAAKVDGMGTAGISFRHVLPGLTNTIVVQAALIFAVGMLIQAGLAFIGFGPPIPEPSWGGMIQGASQHVYDAPWMMVPTGAVLALTVLAANAIGNSLGKAPNAAAPHLPSAAARRQRANAVAAIAADAPAPAEVPKGTLSVRNLSVGVENGVRLVTDVSFDVEPGTVLGLVGESGCGKTMTALSLLGLLPSGVSVTGGQILWNGRNLAAATDKEMEGIRGREIALISQEPMRALDPMFTVGYQLTATVRRLRGMGRVEAKAEATSLLEKVGIVDSARILKTYPHQISGGMAQRVAIALALAGRPRLLVADEPTTALDVTVQAEILSLLRSLVKETGMSVVMVTHDLGVVADLCDQVAVMYAGEVVENGRTDSILDNPRHPYTLALLAADPHANHAADMPERLATISGQVPQPKDWPSTCRFAARCQFAGSACMVPVPLAPSGTGEGLVRCVKADELAVEGLDWVATDVPSHHVLNLVEARTVDHRTVEKDHA